jgi:hypothetical protein
MSGTELQTTQQAAEATVDNRGRRSYTAHYRAKMSQSSDGPAAVLDFLAGRNIYYNVPYAYNGDVDLTAFCNGIAPRRMANSLEWWEVTVSYGPPEEEDPQDVSNNPTDEPEEWRWQHVMGYSTWQEAVWRAYNVSEFPHLWAAGVADHAYKRTLNTLGPVVNSANVVLDPPLMRDLFDRVWQVTTYSRTYDNTTSDTYMGSINDDSAVLQYHPLLTTYYGFTQNLFAYYQIKCTNASAVFRTLIRNQVYIPYWEWNWEFRFRNETWIEYVLDRGLSSIPTTSMATGTKGPNYPEDVIDDGAAAVMPVLDSTGRRVPELVLFDGAGYPMLPDDPRYTEGYYFGWLKDPAVAFKNIPFPFFVEST